MKRLAVLAAPLALGACALPPALTVASYVVDGLTLATSGKSIGDHALSVASGQDCAVLRVIRGKAICHRFAPGEKPYMVAEAERWAQGGEIVGQGTVVVAEPVAVVADPETEVVKPETDPLSIPQVARIGIALSPIAIDADGPSVEATTLSLLARPSQSEPSEAVALRGPEAAGWTDPRPAREVVALARLSEEVREVVIVGSFLDRDNAERAVSRWHGFDPRIVPAEVRGNSFYRVVLTAADGAGKNEDTSHGAIPLQAWRARLCGDDAAAGETCIRL